MNQIAWVIDEYVAGLESRDVDRIAATVADDMRFVMGEKMLAKDRFLGFLRALYAAFPDWTYLHDEPEMREDAIAIRWRQGGTHTGTLSLPGADPIAATGKRVSIPAQYFFYQVRDGRIATIRPDAIAGGAPQAIFEQINAEWPAR